MQRQITLGRSNTKSAYPVILKRATADEWTTHDPILAHREVGIDTTREAIRIGDGERSWSELQDATPEEAHALLVSAR